MLLKYVYHKHFRYEKNTRFKNQKNSSRVPVQLYWEQPWARAHSGDVKQGPCPEGMNFDTADGLSYGNNQTLLKVRREPSRLDGTHPWSRVSENQDVSLGTSASALRSLAFCSGQSSRLNTHQFGMSLRNCLQADLPNPQGSY